MLTKVDIQVSQFKGRVGGGGGGGELISMHQSVSVVRSNQSSFYCVLAVPRLPESRN